MPEIEDRDVGPDAQRQEGNRKKGERRLCGEDAKGMTHVPGDHSGCSWRVGKNSAIVI